MPDNLAVEWAERPSGLIVPKPRTSQSERPKAMDFFAGCGGFTCGLIAGGFEVVAAAEWDPTTAITYMTNLCRWGRLTIHFVTDEDGERLEKALAKSCRAAGLRKENGGIVADGEVKFTDLPLAGTGWIAHEPDDVPGVSHMFFGDIAALETQRVLDTIGMEKGELDLIVGSPPCQGFSRAGKMQADDPRNELTQVFARFITEMRPKSLCMENVPEVAKAMGPDGMPVLDKFCRALEDGGFSTYDALRKALEMQTGSVGLLRGTAQHKDQKSGVDKSAQEDLFTDMEAGNV